MTHRNCRFEKVDDTMNNKEVTIIKQYRKKAIVIEAIQFQSWNLKELAEWIGLVPAIKPGKNGDPEALYIRTLEGEMTVQLGDWIIKDIKGEFYPCKLDVFEATYEPA